MRNDSAVHWRRTYETRSVEELSWTEPVPEISLDLIEGAELGSDAAIIDVGGGASRLAAELLQHDYGDVTVADISPEALNRAQADLRETAGRVSWVEADVREHDFGRRFDLWHDRAVFHFMVSSADRDAYLRTLERSLAPGGHLVLATFGPQGPTECSGLPVSRYDAVTVGEVLGERYRLVSSRDQIHRTPSGTAQQFVYSHWRRR